MNVNFGLFPPLTEAVKSEDGKRLRGPEKSVARKHALSARADRDLTAWLAGLDVNPAAPPATAPIAPAIAAGR